MFVAVVVVAVVVAVAVALQCQSRLLLTMTMTAFELGSRPGMMCFCKRFECKVPAQAQSFLRKPKISRGM